MKNTLFDRISIIGLGLIGSSIARGIKKHHIADILVGCDLSNESLNIARAQKMIDVATTDPKIAVAESQLVIIATPPASMETVAMQISPALVEGAIIMDTGSVKQCAIEAIAPHLPAHVHFIPAHPIAGSEQSGISAGRADLLHKKHVVVTPDAPLEDGILRKVNSFWNFLGARVEAMPPAIHDHLYAYISHLPQLLAFAAQHIITQTPEEDSIMQRFMRLQKSRPALWTEIFLLNKTPLLAALDNYLDVFVHIGRELQEAPEVAPAEDISRSEIETMFARIAASCLATTIMQAEEKSGFSYARYGGSGLHDFMAPIESPPEPHIEIISNHSRQVLPYMRHFADRLKALREKIDSLNAFDLQNLL